LELIQNTQSMKTATASPQAQQSAGSKVSKPSYCNVATPSQCTLCNDAHKLFKCDKFLKLQPRQRYNHVKQQGLCFNCLQTTVKGHTCSQQQCRICYKRHYSLLHIAKQHQVAIANRLATNNSSLSPAQGSTGAEVKTYYTLKGKPRNHILQGTAIIEVRDKTGQYIPCRALLDSGSDQHFITERCVKRLRLSRTQTHTSIQGINNVNSATHHSVSLRLSSRHTDWHKTLACAVLTNITGTTPRARLDISSCKIPKDIKLADEQFN
jgi:hypothetical protein